MLLGRTWKNGWFPMEEDGDLMVSCTTLPKERQDVTGGSCVKDEDGNIVTDTEGVQEVWRRYMERLLNVENEWDKWWRVHFALSRNGRWLRH